MKKLVLTAVIACLAFAAFAQPAAPKGPDFKNKTYSDIVEINGGTNTKSFAGIYNNTKVELLSGKVDCGIDATFGLIKQGPIQFTEMEVNDWYIEFRPFQKFTFGISDVIYTHGSYLPVLDTNIKTGDIGSNIVVVWRPIVGARIGLGYGIPSFFAEDNNGDESHPIFNFGADYTYGKLFSIGLSMRNIINDLSIGVYSEMLAVDHLYLTFGFTHNDKVFTKAYTFETPNYYGVGGENLISVGATYDFNKVGFGFDFLTNLGETGYYDFYIGAKTSAKVTDKVTLAFKFQTALSTDDDGITNEYEFNPSFAYAEKMWGFGAGVDIKKADSIIVSFPVYFEFSL